jgi:hypothetical protein
MPQNLTLGRSPRLAVVGTVYRKYSHLQNILDRFLDGYGWNGTYHHSPMDVVSLFVDQRAPDDITQDRLYRYPMMKRYPTIAEALCLGTGKLAVDGVVVVGEHGQYPPSPNGIPMHPHWEFFEQITTVFRNSGRSVPYFNDKELSWKWEWCKQMVDTSKEMGFPLQGGSSLAVCYRIPSVEFPLGATVHEALAIGYGGVGSYDFHVLETIQCMVERRKGGETGVEWLQTYRGDAFWKAYEEEVWSHALVKAALSRSDYVTPAPPTFTYTMPSTEQMRALVRNPIAYHYQHRDGLRCTMLLMDGLVKNFTFAAQIVGQPKPFSTLMYLSDVGPHFTVPSHFSPLVYEAEQMFLTRKAQYPIERTLLTSGLLIAGVDSALQGGQRLQTPNLAAVNYQPNPESTFWRS